MHGNTNGSVRHGNRHHIIKQAPGVFVRKEGCCKQRFFAQASCFFPFVPLNSSCCCCSYSYHGYDFDDRLSVCRA